MSANEEDEKRELYEFNDDYLDDLNEIRKQFNLVEIGREDTSIAENTSLDSSQELTVDEELCKDDNNYLEKLRNARGELDLGEIQNRGRNSLSILEDSLADKKDAEELENVQLMYTPPKKKMCLRSDYFVEKFDRSNQTSMTSSESKDSSRSSQISSRNYCCLETGREKKKKIRRNKVTPAVVSKITESDREVIEGAKKLTTNFSPEIQIKQLFPVTEKSLPFYKKTVKISESEETFCSLNVPTLPADKDKTATMRSTVTVLVEGKQKPPEEENEEQNIDLRLIRTPIKIGDSDKQWEMSGLDLPRLSNESYNFPSVVHIAQWPNLLNEERKFDKIFTEKTDMKKNIDNQKRDEDDIDTLFEEKEDKGPRRKRKSALSVESGAVRFEELQSDTDDEEPKGCQCFSICFKKKPKNYFA